MVKWRKGNDKRKRCAAQKSGTSLYILSSKLRKHGGHAMLSFLSSLPIPVLRILDIEANWFYDRNHQMYEAALLNKCYTQHALHPFIDAAINHQRHFIKIPFIHKGMFFSSPEPLGSQGELIAYPSSRRPSVRRPSSVGVRRPSFTMLKDLLLRNRWADQSQILCGASLGRGNDILFAASGSHDQDGRHAHIW